MGGMKSIPSLPVTPAGYRLRATRSGPKQDSIVPGRVRWAAGSWPLPGRMMRNMDYAEAKVAFFQPRPSDAPPPGSSTWRSPARLLRDAIEPIATICFWSEVAYDKYAALGL